MKPQLICVDTNELMVEVLGLFTAVQAVVPNPNQPTLALLIGRVVHQGPQTDEECAKAIPHFTNLRDDNLVVFQRHEGLALMIDGQEYRLLNRERVLMALDPAQLEDEGVEVESLAGPIPPWPSQQGEGCKGDCGGGCTSETGPEEEKTEEVQPEPEPEPEPVIPTIQIEWINARGQGFATYADVPEGTTLEGLLKIKGIEPKGRELRILTPGLGEVPPMADYVLQAGDHVEAVPVEVGVGFGG